MELGQLVKDKVTGFEGIAVGITTYLYGCNSVGISPKYKKGCPVLDTCWFDIGRIVVMGKGILPEEVQSILPGGRNRDCIGKQL